MPESSGRPPSAPRRLSAGKARPGSGVAGSAAAAGLRTGSANRRLGSASDKYTPARIAPDETEEPTLRRTLSIASAAVQQTKENDAFREENLEACDFLNTINQDYENILVPGELVPSNLIENFGNSARSLLASLRLGKTSDELSNTQKAFKQVLADSLNRSIGMTTRADASATPPPGNTTLMQRSLKRRPLSVEPLPDRLQRQIQSKLEQQAQQRRALARETLGVNFATGRATNPLLRAPTLAATMPGALMAPPPKSRTVTVVMGNVNYGKLLQEQAAQRAVADEKNRDYERIMREYDEAEAAIERRFSMMLKPQQKLLSSPQRNDKK